MYYLLIYKYLYILKIILYSYFPLLLIFIFILFLIHLLTVHSHFVQIQKITSICNLGLSSGSILCQITWKSTRLGLYCHYRQPLKQRRKQKTIHCLHQGRYIFSHSHESYHICQSKPCYFFFDLLF